MYLPNLCLQCILLKKRIEGPLCPEFYRHPSSNLSAINARCARWYKDKPLASNLAGDGSRTQQKLNRYVSNLCLQCNSIKKRIEGTLCPVFHLPVPAGKSWSHDQCPPSPECAPCFANRSDLTNPQPFDRPLVKNWPNLFLQWLLSTPNRSCVPHQSSSDQKRQALIRPTSFTPFSALLLPLTLPAPSLPCFKHLIYWAVYPRTFCEPMCPLMVISSDAASHQRIVCSFWPLSALVNRL